MYFYLLYYRIAIIIQMIMIRINILKTLIEEISEFASE